MSKKQGALIGSLTRNSGQVKRDRAEIIDRSAGRYYKRKLEDLQAELEELEAGREAQLDMSPSDINKIVTAAEFQSKEWCEKDFDYTLRIREIKIRIDACKERIDYLFGSEEPAVVS